jgi:SAM-dependent methyltransferase
METWDFTEVVATYDTVAALYASRFPTTEPEDPLELAMIDHFVARLGPSPSVLDAGCGTGRMSRYLADRGCRVTGVDLSPGMVAMARRDHPDLAFSVGSIVDLPYADASVDAAMYWYSVIHSPDSLLPRIAAEAVRVVRPGGLVLLAFQVGAGSRDVANGYRALGHDVSITRFDRSLSQMEALLADAGVDVVARLERQPVAGEKEPQGFLIGAHSGWSPNAGVGSSGSPNGS